MVRFWEKNKIDEKELPFFGWRDRGRTSILLRCNHCTSSINPLLIHSLIKDTMVFKKILRTTA